MSANSEFPADIISSLKKTDRSEEAPSDEGLSDRVAKSSYGGSRASEGQGASVPRPPSEPQANVQVKYRVPPELKDEITRHKNAKPGRTYLGIMVDMWDAYKEKHGITFD